MPSRSSARSSASTTRTRLPSSRSVGDPSGVGIGRAYPARVRAHPGIGYPARRRPSARTAPSSSRSSARPAGWPSTAFRRRPPAGARCRPTRPPGVNCAPPTPSSPTITVSVAAVVPHPHPGILRRGVFRGVRQRLGDREVDRRFHRRGRSAVEVDVHLDRPGMGEGQRCDPAGQPAVGEHRRMDAAHQRAQFGQRGASRTAGPRRSARRRPPGRGRPVPAPVRGSSPRATSWACAPSCRSRSIRRSSAAEWSTVSRPGGLEFADPFLEPAVLRADQQPGRGGVGAQQQGRSPPAQRQEGEGDQRGQLEREPDALHLEQPREVPPGGPVAEPEPQRRRTGRPVR